MITSKPTSVNTITAHSETPIVEMHNNIAVVRDDLYPGGTKARLFDRMFKEHRSIAYGCSPLSCTQVPLAISAKRAGGEAHIFTGRRQVRSGATSKALEEGAQLHEVFPGYLNVVQARARAWCAENGAHMAPLGFDTPEVVQALADIAKTAPFEPAIVWCAAGSGTLSRALQLAFPKALHYAVAVGKPPDVGTATLVNYSGAFERPTKYKPPFPSEPHYDAKAYEILMSLEDSGLPTLFWNVLGDIIGDR